jgi:hypothetical protein
VRSLDVAGNEERERAVRNIQALTYDNGRH